MNVLEVKALVRQRDGYRCTRCGVTQDDNLRLHGRQLDVHRLTPGSAYSVEGCITVCRLCHGSLPKRRPGEPDLANPRPNLIFRLPPDLRSAVETYAQRERRSLAQSVLLLMEKALVARGAWPPPAAD